MYSYFAFGPADMSDNSAVLPLARFTLNDVRLKL